MKFDSYTRFLKSQLYQECILAEVEGRPLPDAQQVPSSPASKHSVSSDHSNVSTPKKVPRSPSPVSLERAVLWGRACARVPVPSPAVTFQDACSCGVGEGSGLEGSEDRFTAGLQLPFAFHVILK